MSIRVLVVDDHPALRKGLRSIFQPRFGYQIIGEAADGLTAVRLAAEHRPDVVLMDVLLPGMEGPEATRRVLAACPTCRILAFSGAADAGHVCAMLDAGASGYLAKMAEPALMREAVDRVAAGDLFLGPGIAVEAAMSVPQLGVATAEETADIAPAADPASGAQLPPLPPRAREILGLIGDGLEPKEIAGLLGLSENTVRVHLRNLMKRLGTNRSRLLGKYAILYGLTSVIP